MNVVRNCVLCDFRVFLILIPKIYRQPVVEFGWVVGIPDRVQSYLHTHARHAAAERGTGRNRSSGTEGATETGDKEGVAAQMVYHRPTRSGIYAFVSLFQPWRIGLNEISYTYPIEADDRRERYVLALRAYEWTPKRPDGAIRSSRFPHIERAEGISVVSSNPVPIPILSPLCDDYWEKLLQLAAL